MKLSKRILKGMSVPLFLVLLLQVASCGTLMYPERRGQTGGRIDPAVAILDGVGLLLFIIPGAIAFGVDFATGSIYLPKGNNTASISFEPEDTLIVQVSAKELNKQRIEEIIRKQTGQSIKLDDKNLKIYELDAPEYVDKKLTALTDTNF